MLSHLPTAGGCCQRSRRRLFSAGPAVGWSLSAHHSPTVSSFGWCGCCQKLRASTSFSTEWQLYSPPFSRLALANVKLPQFIEVGNKEWLLRRGWMMFSVARDSLCSCATADKGSNRNNKLWGGGKDNLHISDVNLWSDGTLRYNNSALFF